MPVRFYNTLSRKVEDFRPIKEGEATVYTCGPTVYNFPHIGNLRTFLFEDLLCRYLEYRGYHVKQVMNLTDVDDKTIKNSIKCKMSLSDYTAIYKKAFFDDIKALNIKPAFMYPAATEHIEGMIEMINTLLKTGHAYESADGVYFKVSSMPNYGRLANLEHDSLKAGASGRLATDEYSKEDIADFALWKKYTPEDGDVKWEAPFGAGRPGWHLECSVMSMKYLGETIDIHAGGVDLIFPHHTNEIAQSEAVTGKPFVNNWLHSSHLVVDGEKMSKSKGNFYTLRDLQEKGFGNRSVRYALFTTHYRKPLNFTFDGITQADSSLKRIDNFVFELKQCKNAAAENAKLSDIVNKARQDFIDALDEDLNIAEAIACVFDMISAFYELKAEWTHTNSIQVLDFFNEIDRVLGFMQPPQVAEISDEIKSLLDARLAAKAAKDYKKADEIRNELLKLGIEVRDTKDGAVWKRI